MSASPGPHALRTSTLADVARHAGVHSATVSRALNHPDKVAAATRGRVMAAIAELGFVPNDSARRLAGGRAEALGVVVPDIANPYFATILQTLQAEATERGLAVLIADSAGDPNAEEQMLDALSRRVDGLVVCTPVSDLSAARVPVVQVNRQSRAVPSVVVDQSTIVDLAVDHLVALGHRRVAYLPGPSRYWSARRRTLQVRRINRDRRARVRIEVVHPVAGTFDAGRAVLGEVCATGATAVLAFNDLQAAGLVVGAHDAGLDVPGDLSIIGSDGLDLATMTEPTLTTVVAPRATVGKRALQRLLTDDGLQRTVLQPTLSQGDSTGHPHSHATHPYDHGSFDIDAG